MENNSQSQIKNISIQKEGDELVICYLWRKQGRLFPAVFFILWNLLLSGIMFDHFSCVAEKGTACYDTGYGFHIMNALALLDIFLLYLAAGYLVNTFYIRVTKERIDFQIMGLPWMKRKAILSSEIKDIYLSGRKIYVGKTATNKTYYTVYLRKKKGMEKLFREFYNREDADFFADPFCSKMGIEKTG